MNKIIPFFVAGLAIVVSGMAPAGLFAQENVKFPVEELGNCADKAGCKAYCDKPENAAACLEFAQKYKLMSQDEIKKAEVFTALGNSGPGGCKTKEACDSYCDDTNNMKECISFAEKNGLLSGTELEEAKKAQAAIAGGLKPPACKGKKECDVYCENPLHMEECVTFAMKAGFMQGKELEDAQKMLAAVKKGAKLPACKGKEECDAYCGQEIHFDECAAFAEAAGFMNADELAMARKTKGKGPGGCKSREECDSFCNNPDNQETCFNFGKENGLIPAGELQKMEEGKQKMKEALAGAPAEVIACLQAAFGADKVEKIKNGTFMPPQDSANSMSACFDKMKNQQMPGGPGAGGGMAPGTGPGGCKSPDECKIYCEAHADECKNFQTVPRVVVPGEGQGMSGGNQPGGQVVVGPGGCKTPEECKTYCESHIDECKNFSPAVGNQQQNNSMPNAMPAGQMIVGPGGCKSPEECGAYCRQNPQACQSFSPPAGQAPLPPAGNIQSQAPMNGQAPVNAGPGAGGALPPGDYMPLMPGQQLNEANPVSPQPPAGFQSPDQFQPPMPPVPAPPANPVLPPSGFLAPESILASFAAFFANLLSR